MTTVGPAPSQGWNFVPISLDCAEDASFTGPADAVRTTIAIKCLGSNLQRVLEINQYRGLMMVHYALYNDAVDDGNSSFHFAFSEFPPDLGNRKDSLQRAPDVPHLLHFSTVHHQPLPDGPSPTSNSSAAHS